MPLIRLQTNQEMPASLLEGLLSDMTSIVAESIGKPESSVMANIQPAEMLMSGEPGPAALVEVKSIGGLDAEVNGRITAGICCLLEERLGIPGRRVYVNFSDIAGSDWGWDGSTFA